MRWWLGLLGLVTCPLSGCRASANAPAATPQPRASPAAQPSVLPGITARPKRPLTLYSQEHVGKGTYQLINNVTYQFVQATARGVRTLCAGGTGCTDYVMIGVTDYSGNTRVAVSPRQLALMSTAGVRYAPAPPRQASRVVPTNGLLPTTVLQPDDDGDFASGTVVFLVPRGAGRFSLLWQDLHVATFVKGAHGTLHETR